MTNRFDGRRFPLNKDERAAMGERVQAGRHVAGLTLKAVAEQVGVNVHSVVQWEHGAVPRDEMRAALSVLFEVDRSLLFAEYESKLSAISARWSAGTAQQVRTVTGLQSTAPEWAKELTDRLEQMQWEISELRMELNDHRDEEGWPNGFAHTAPTETDVRDDGTVYETFEDPFARVDALEHRLAAVAEALSSPS
jgi:transcriptional regulator with XRE-family HTH domain